MAEILADHPFQGSGDSELDRLQRLLPALAAGTTSRDLHEAIRAILAYEDCYRLVLLGFERLLWLCRTLPAASISPSDLSADPVLQLVCERLPPAAARFRVVLDGAQSKSCATKCIVWKTPLDFSSVHRWRVAHPNP